MLLLKSATAPVLGRHLRRRGLLLEAVVEHKFAVSLTRAALLHSLLLALALVVLIVIVAVRAHLSHCPLTLAPSVFRSSIPSTANS